MINKLLITRDMDLDSVVKTTSISVTTYCLEIGELFHHLGHCGAFLSTVSARFRTSCHLFVVREFFACGGASIAALGTAFTCVSTEITLASTK